LGRGPAGRWVPVALWMAFIFWLSAQPKPPLCWIMGCVKNADKLGHASVYLVLGALLWRALRDRYSRWGVVVAVTVVAVAYGLSDEAHQLYVPGRSFDLLDLTADGVGAALAAAILAMRWGGNAVVGRTGTREDL
jgi:VanZ family protein